MNNLERKLLIEQLDKKFKKLSILDEIQIPEKGWINTIRTALNMSLSQLAKRLKKTIPSVKETEEREANKNITLKKLMEVAEALGLKFVYGFVPKEKSLGKKIESRALQVAENIVMRTSHMMSLEEQQTSKDGLKKAIKKRAEKIKQEMPKHLWE